MYARAQERMLQLRDMASRGMANLAASAAAPPSRAPASAGLPRRDPRSRSSETSEPAVSSRGASVAELAERLDAAAAAAEILFDMRASTAGGADAGAEEEEMLSQLRAVCEDHLDVLARTVQRGDVTNEQLLVRAIEVAESLVSAIGDDEVTAAAVAAEEETVATAARAEGAPPRAGGGDGVGVGGWRRDLATPPPATEAESAMADLLGGLDVGGPAPSSAPSPAFTPGDGYRPPTMDVGSPAPSDRPTTEAEEEAMIAAALAASLADAQPQEQSQHPPLHAQPQTRGGDLLDAFAPPPASPAPASASPRPAPSPAPGATAAPNLIDF